jgi:superfamily II DNA or RNA helicase
MAATIGKIAATWVHDYASVAFSIVGFVERDVFNLYRENVTGARWTPALKANLAKIDSAMVIIHKLTKAGFSVETDAATEIELNAKRDKAAGQLASAEERLSLTQTKLAKEGKALYPFQVDGAKRLSWRDRYLLADEMGLGKTVQAIMAAPEGAPIVVVCPAIAKAVWVREFAKWRGKKVKLVSGRGKFAWPKAGQIVVVNYDILPKPKDPCDAHDDCASSEALARACTNGAPEAGTVLIADEAHYLKSSKSSRTIAFRAMAVATREAGGKVWLLTGTPLLNKAPELWAVLSAADLARDAFGSWDNFKALFGAYDGRYGIVWGQVTDSARVAECLSKVMLRRKYSAVMAELPAKRYDEISVDLDKETMRECDAILEALEERGYSIDDLIEGKVPFEGIARTRAILATAKIPAMLEQIEAYEEAEEPLIVFSAHRAPIDAIAGREGWAVITGDTNHDERGRIEDAFRAGKLRGVAGTIGAMGTAVRFERASHLLFVDKVWTPGANSQAEARIQAVTQKNSALIKSLVGSHDLDIQVETTLRRKQRLIDDSVDA